MVASTTAADEQEWPRPLARHYPLGGRRDEFRRRACNQNARRKQAGLESNVLERIQIIWLNTLLACVVVV